MITQAFEIKVALLGYVSVGKTTVLNALFQDKYSETTMRRTTAGINFFRISAPNSGAKRRNDGADGSKHTGKPRRSKESKEMEWTAETEEVRSPTSTLQEIKADNVVLRDKNEIQEKYFDIELDEHLCEMRKDTKLVIVDIPGVNEAGSNKLYMDYVNNKWDSFDCVVVVLDAKQGANTEEQVHLLELVKKNTADKKDLPVIILCNKVDDPEEEEMKVMIDEVHTIVEKIFEVDCRKAALTNALHAYKQRNGCGSSIWPSLIPISAGHAFLYRIACRLNLVDFKKLDAEQHNGCGMHGSSMWPSLIPISAGHAFLYRTACRLKLEDFKKLDADFIEKLGRDEVGRMKWKKLSQAEKYEAAYSAVSEDSEYKERLEATQFDKFLDILALSCGGEARQQEILQKQIDISMKKLSWKGNIADQLLSVYERSKSIGQPTIMLREKFWSEYKNHFNQAVSAFSHDMNMSDLHGAMDQLREYFDRVVPAIYKDNKALIKIENKEVIASMEQLVKIQCGIILEKEAKWDVGSSSMMVASEYASDSSEYQSQIQYQSQTHNPRAWYNSVTGQTIYSNDPPESPFHWERTEHGWQNKWTNSLVQSERNPGFGKVTWALLSPHDWFTIIRSLLLCIYNKHFCEHFGQEIVMLERTICHGKAAKILNSFNEKNPYYHNKNSYHRALLAGSMMSEYTRGAYSNGVFKPDDKTKYGLVIQIEMPPKLSDPDHWGHLAWKFCEFMKKM